MLFLFSVVCVGCAGGGDWGARVGWPDAQGFRAAAVAAASSPHTWAPLTGAALLTIGDADEDLADWAVRRQPLFGSDAARASDRLRDLDTVAYGVSALVVPSDSIWSRTKGIGVGAVALLAEQEIVSATKAVTGRERPNGANDRSFPSGHTSRASVAAAMAAANVEVTPMPGWTRRSLQAGLYGVAAATGWARIEAGVHYPTDVLVGYAIGQFIARFSYHAFLYARPGDTGASALPWAFTPLPDGALLTWSIRPGGW